MKKASKVIMAVLVFAMALTLTACGGSGGTKGTEASGDMVTATIPSGWSLVSGTEMQGIKTEDFICHSKEYKVGDPYLQVEQDSRSIDAMKAVLESESPYGTYAGEKKLANGTWYIAKNIAITLLDDKVLTVKGYQCDFSSDEVQGILGSIQWKK